VTALAGNSCLDDALDALVHSPYGETVPAGADLGAAEHAVAASALWNVRVLAGWLPAAGATALRVLAGWFEIANTDEHLWTLTGRGSGVAPFRLGTLAMAWPRIAATASPAEVRTVLSGSAWGDPGTETPYDIGLSMRMAWAARVSAAVAPAKPWAAGGAAIMVARERYAVERDLPEGAARAAASLLGPRAMSAASFADFLFALRTDAAWPMRAVRDPADLWLAEVAWWRRLYADGLRLLATRGFGEHKVYGAVAVLAADAWRVRAALNAAAAGGATDEVRDALG
jgi:hypothetical protein